MQSFPVFSSILYQTGPFGDNRTRTYVNLRAAPLRPLLLVAHDAEVDELRLLGVRLGGERRLFHAAFLDGSAGLLLALLQLAHQVLVALKGAVA